MKTIYTYITENNTIKSSIDYNQYIDLVHETMKLKCEDIIKLHNYLIGKISANELCKIDLGEKYLLNLLSYDYGYYLKELPEELIKFFNSKHLSNYLKKLIIKYVNNPSNDLLNIIYSKKDFNQYNELELNTIYKSLEQLGLGELIVSLSFKLNSQESKDFLNNYINPLTIIKRIIYTSGLSIRPEYYQSNTVNKRDLNSQNLISIYNKLNNIDEFKALNMAKMTLNLKILDPRTFIKSLYLLVASNYNYETFIGYYNNDYSESELEKQLSNYLETNEIKTSFIKLLPKETLDKISNEEISSKENNSKKYLKRTI